MITDDLTNIVYFSSLLPSVCPVLDAHITEALRKRGIPFGYLSGTKDIWCRDYMPIQLDNSRLISYKYTPDYLQEKRYIHLQTNPDDVLQTECNGLLDILPTENKSDVAFDGLRPISIIKPVVKTIKLDLVLDGGNVVKCGNRIVMTEKVFAENSNMSRHEVVKILEDAFHCEIVFLPWDKKEIFGHSDGIIHYAGGNKVLMTNYEDFDKGWADCYRKILEKHFEVVPLSYPVKRKHQRSWAYINFLQVGTLVLVPQLGIEEDALALRQIGDAMPGHETVGIPALEAVRRGGALNCISWNISYV